MSKSIRIVGADKLAEALHGRAKTQLMQAIVKNRSSKLQSGTISRMNASYTHGFSTGATARSTKLALSDGGLTGTVSVGTKYFPYLEKGTRFMAAMPTLGPEFNVQSTALKSDIQKLMK